MNEHQGSADLRATITGMDPREFELTGITMRNGDSFMMTSSITLGYDS